MQAGARSLKELSPITIPCRRSSTRLSHLSLLDAGSNCRPVSSTRDSIAPVWMEVQFERGSVYAFICSKAELPGSRLRLPLRHDPEAKSIRIVLLAIPDVQLVARNGPATKADLTVPESRYWDELPWLTLRSPSSTSSSAFWPLSSVVRPPCPPRPLCPL